MSKKVIETVNGWYMENPKQKVELDDIVGLVKTDEPTDSVQLKKEAQLSIYEKRIIELENENEQLKQFKEKIFTSIEKEIARNEKTIEWKKETLDLLNEFYEINKKLHDENEELKKENEFLKKRCDEYWEETGLNNDYFE